MLKTTIKKNRVKFGIKLDLINFHLIGVLICKTYSNLYQNERSIS